ncbi:MAG TPA: 23S rRNA (pseudouridine(1915)-N(3))-methyltransferase RlmH [Polyangiaceae bacterium]|nr:23S rRNA (pseudouridine(1915)-N(3))-methyltransferase RlmH [Polyangiaceae bacterium]
MRLWVVAAGKIKEKPLRLVADDYLGRIARYARIDEVETRDETGLAKAIPEGARLIALEVLGTAYSSERFAKKLESWGSTGKGEIAFVIGAAEGIPAELSKRADERISLSTMTLPHRLARVLLYEQIYRGFSILRGEPYAREG